MEENLVKKENGVMNSNNNSNNGSIIAVLSLIIIVLIVAVVYFAFIKKDDNKDGNNQQQQNNNQETGLTTPTVAPTSTIVPTPRNTSAPTTSSVPTNTSVVLRKMLFDSCSSIDKTFNGIKVEVQDARKEADTIGCEGKLFINGKKISDFDGQGIDSIEIYDKYVIVYGGTSANGKLLFYDTSNNNKVINPDLGKYFQSQGYISNDEGLIVIASSHAGEFGAKEPEHFFRKLKIKYSNGKFDTPKIIEEYDEYKELVE